MTESPRNLATGAVTLLLYLLLVLSGLAVIIWAVGRTSVPDHHPYPSLTDMWALIIHLWIMLRTGN